MSRTQRRAGRTCRVALAAAAAVLLAGCSSDDTPADSAGSATGAAADGTAAADDTAAASGDFCGQAAQIDQRVDDALTSLEGDDPSIADAFRQLATELRGLEAPEAIAADWDALSSGLDRMGQAFADFDPTDPDTLQALDQAEDDLSTASSNVETYLREECGIDP